MILTNRDIKTIYFCPKKARYEIQNSNGPNLPQDIKTFSTDAFGCLLVVIPDEIVSRSPYVLKIKKTGKKLSDYHFLEAAFIGYVLESCGQEVGSIIFESEHYSTSVNWRPYVTRMLSLLSYFCTETDYKVSKTHLCRLCPFVEKCFHEARAIESIDFLHGLRGKTAEKLRKIGIDSIKDLLNQRDRLIEHFGPERTRKLIAHARSVIENRPVLFAQPPQLENGIFLDIESYTPTDFDYLFGVLSDGTYIPFLARDQNEEVRAFRNVLEFIDQTSGPVYHFHQYEVQRFKKLAKRYGIDIPKEFFKRFVDVYKLYADHVALPVPSYSLKVLARYFGFQWRNDINGRTVIDTYARYMSTGDEDILNAILVYNEDDVRATELLVSKLREMCSTKELEVL
ncbi:recombinase RecB [Fervidobacterium thailandense]|uniref:Recombinase RecB n=2 Tax=Fervidobacterium thailandense TaxID=1008305 RepID=A0A1E3G6D2_9BACT|nr:recombinase RecB [Fervidobacterium thailandense]